LNIEVISLDGKLTPAELNQLYTAVGWDQECVRTDEKTRIMLGQSSFYATARVNHQLVGFGRVMSDAYVAHILDLIVNPAFRKKGVARRIMTELVKFVRSNNYFGVMLVNGRGLQGFYEKFGFEAADSRQEVVMYLTKNAGRPPGVGHDKSC
jgi:ribosomal protein S18 acetylase RimI-like enzyme